MSGACARRRPRILVLTGDHTLPDPTKWDGRYDESDLELDRRMREALATLADYDFDFLSEHDRLVERLRADPPDLVLNFCDTGFRNVASQELHVPALLELMGIPCTGAPPECMVLAYDKAVVRLLADSLGVPAPCEAFVPADLPLDAVASLPAPYPALVKPNRGDGSVGITRDAVVRSPDEACAYLAWMREALPGAAALIQEYLPGAEYGLALVGNPGHGFVAFPPLEVDFSELSPELAPILSFESKTGPETPYSAVRIRRAAVDEETVATLRRRAELLFARLHCCDYARFDFRTGADGEIKLMEVNPNPAWSPEAKLALMAGFGGVAYPQLLERIVRVALARLAASP
jgi:D-alanine-D-alanine ligase